MEQQKGGIISIHDRECSECQVKNTGFHRIGTMMGSMDQRGMWKYIFGVMKQLRGTFDKMDKEKRRKLDLILYGGAAIVSFFALYTFIFIFDNGMGWKIALIIIGIGWLLSAISGFLKALKK